MSKNAPVTVTETAKSIGHYPIAEIAEQKLKMIQEGKTVYDFGPGDDPLPIDSSIIDFLKQQIPMTSQYPLVKGSLNLREAIKNYIGRRFGVTIDTSQLLPVTGSKEGIYHLPSLFIDAKSTRRLVLGPALAYPPYIKGAEIMNGTYVPLQGGAKENYLIELGDVDPETLSQTAIAYLNYPHNPTGATCDLEYLERQVRVAKEYGFVLVSDECYADIYFGDSPPPSILQVTTEGVLAFHSLSKRSGMTGFRSGFVAGDKTYIEAYGKLRNAIGTALPGPIDIASIAAWSDDVHVEQRRFAFEAIRNRFLEFFDELGLEYLKTNASFYLWGKAPEGQTGMSYAEALRKRGIFIGPSDFFGEGSPEWFRVSLVLPIKDSEAAFVVWKEVHQSL